MYECRGKLKANEAEGSLIKDFVWLQNLVYSYNKGLLEQSNLYSLYIDKPFRES